MEIFENIQKELLQMNPKLLLCGSATMGYVLLLCCFLLVVKVQGQEKLQAERRIPVMAWSGVPESETTFERYKELADAGFTHNFSWFGSITSNEKALDVAQTAGIKQFVNCPELAKDPEGVAKKFMKHPALAGYHLRDEPKIEDFAELSKWAKRIQSIDSTHWCYINLLPNSDSNGATYTKNYQEYVDSFIAVIPTEALTFDKYPIIDNRLRAGWYENLEIITQAAKKAKKPFWAFTLAVEHQHPEGHYPTPKLEHLRLQVFSDLVYGAFGIQYFTYWTPPFDAQWQYQHGPIEANGKKSDTYELVRQMNEEIKGLSAVFVGSEVVALGHTGTLPQGTNAYVAMEPIESVKTEGNGAVVSLLSQKKRRFLAIVNRDYRGTMPLTVTFNPKAHMASVDKKGVLHPLSGNEFKATVDKGDIVILTWLVN